MLDFLRIYILVPRLVISADRLKIEWAWTLNNTFALLEKSSWKQRGNIMENVQKNLTENLDSPFPLDRQERQVSSTVIKKSY